MYDLAEAGRKLGSCEREPAFEEQGCLVDLLRMNMGFHFPHHKPTWRLLCSSSLFVTCFLTRDNMIIYYQKRNYIEASR